MIKASTCKYLVDNLSWILPIVISIVNVFFSLFNLLLICSQQKMQNDAFCYQLQDKRANIYHEIQSLMRQIFESGIVTPDIISGFKSVKFDVELYFGKDVTEIFCKMHDEMIRLYVVQQRCSQHISGQKEYLNHAQNCEDEGTLLLSITDTEYKNLKNAIKRYIDFSSYFVRKR